MSDIIIGGKKINMAMLNVLNNPVLTHSPTGILPGKIARVNGQGCVREVSLAQVSCIYTDVCLCCSAHTSGCVVDGLVAMAVH